MGKFTQGFLIGVGVGLVYAVFNAPRTGAETRMGITSSWRGALNAGKQASEQRQQQLWNQLRDNTTSSNGTPAAWDADFGNDLNPRRDLFGSDPEQAGL